MADLPSFRRILLVTDFSDCSQAAAPFTALLAERYGATVFVAHVIPDVSATTAAPSAAVPHAGTAEAQLRGFLAANPLGDVHVETIIETGPVADVLAAVIRDKTIDLVVIGTHGRSGVGKLLLGSIAQRIFNAAPCPVLTVSPRARRSVRPTEPFATILYPTDFSEDSLKALPYGLSLTKTRGSKLVLLHATSELLRHEVLQEYYRRLNSLIPPEARAWCKSDALVITGTPAEVILHAASEQNADFIVIGAHRAEGTFTVPLTTAYQVVAHAHCPVLRVRT